MSSTQACFGFELRSPLSFQFARRGPGLERLSIAPMAGAPPRPDRPPIYDWRVPVPGGEIQSALHRDGEGFGFWNSEVGWYRMTPRDHAIEVPSGEGVDPARREQLLWNLPATVCIVERGDLALHGAAVEIDGQAVILAAPGHHGKTTLALAFHERGYRVLSEDVACCRLDSEPVLLPGPALLRIRSASSEPYTPEGTRIATSGHGRVVLEIDEERRGDSAPVPIRAAAFIRPSSDGVQLERVPPQAAISDLWALAFHFPEDAARARCFSQVADLASAIRVVDLHRPFDIARLSETVDLLVAACAD